MNKFNLMSKASSLGFTIVFCIIGSFLIGLQIDRHFGTAPLFMLLLLFFGIFSAGFSVFKFAKQSEKYLNQKRNDE